MIIKGNFIISKIYRPKPKDDKPASDNTYYTFTEVSGAGAGGTVQVTFPGEIKDAAVGMPLAIEAEVRGGEWQGRQNLTFTGSGSFKPFKLSA